MQSIPVNDMDQNNLYEISVTKRKVINYAKYPQPSYSKFGKIDYVDSLGREYHRVSNDDDSDLTPSDGEVKFWVKIPIRLKNNVGFPDSQGQEKIKLLDVNSYTESSGIIEGSFYGPRRKTGYVTIKNIKTSDFTDPQEWGHIVNKKDRQKFKKEPF